MPSKVDKRLLPQQNWKTVLKQIVDYGTNSIKHENCIRKLPNAYDIQRICRTCISNRFLVDGEQNAHIRKYNKHFKSKCSWCRCEFLFHEETTHHINTVHENKASCSQCDFQTHFKYSGYDNSIIANTIHKVKSTLVSSNFGNRKLLSSINAQSILFHISRIKNANIGIMQKLENKILLNEKDAAVLLLQIMSFQYCGDMIIICRVCDGKFLQKRIKNHMYDDHADLRKLICNLCDWTTLLTHQMISHKQKHKMGRRIHCPHCPYSCVEIQQLLTHKKIKHNVYKNMCLG